MVEESSMNNERRGKVLRNSASKSGMAKVFPHAVHSYRTTLPNNMIWGTNLGFSSIASNEG